MTVLQVPLHLPIKQTRPMIERELRFREVVSVKVRGCSMFIEHKRMSHESKAELLSCVEGPIIV